MGKTISSRGKIQPPPCLSFSFRLPKKVITLLLLPSESIRLSPRVIRLDPPPKKAPPLVQARHISLLSPHSSIPSKKLPWRKNDAEFFLKLEEIYADEALFMYAGKWALLSFKYSEVEKCWEIQGEGRGESAFLRLKAGAPSHKDMHKGGRICFASYWAEAPLPNLLWISLSLSLSQVVRRESLRGFPFLFLPNANAARS